MSFYIYLIVISIALLWLLVLTFFVFRLILHYRNLTKGANQKDLMNSLNNLIDNTNLNKKEIDSLHKKHLDLQTASMDYFQKIGFKRFNPFLDTGGDQSFILTLLDANNNGIVISSLHSRENTRIYAKAVKNGKPVKQILSKEEWAVLSEIKHKNNNL